MRRMKEVRALARAIKPYGLRIVNGHHRKVVNADGNTVYAIPGTPSCPYFAENTLHALARRRLIPASIKSTRIRG